MQWLYNLVLGSPFIYIFTKVKRKENRKPIGFSLKHISWALQQKTNANKAKTTSFRPIQPRCARIQDQVRIFFKIHLILPAGALQCWIFGHVNDTLFYRNIFQDFFPNSTPRSFPLKGKTLTYFLSYLVIFWQRWSSKESCLYRTDLLLISGCPSCPSKHLTYRWQPSYWHLILRRWLFMETQRLPSNMIMSTTPETTFTPVFKKSKEGGTKAMGK